MDLWYIAIALEVNAQTWKECKTCGKMLPLDCFLNRPDENIDLCSRTTPGEPVHAGSETRATKETRLIMPKSIRSLRPQGREHTSMRALNETVYKNNTETLKKRKESAVYGTYKRQVVILYTYSN